MPRENSTNWSVGDNVSATRLQQINSDLDDLYSNGSDRLKVYASTGLNILIGAGVFRVGSTEGIYAGGTVAMTDNATNYVMIDSSGVIQVSTSNWNADYARLAVVTTVSGAIDSIVVWRIDAIGGVLGGGISLLATGGVNTTATNATFTANAGTDTITSNGHNLQNGDKVTLTTTGTLPAGLSLSTGYFVINKTANTFQLATLPFRAAIDITDAGTGTHTWTNAQGSINLSFTAKKQLKIIMYAVPTASSLLRMTFNEDGTGSKYGTRQSTAGGTESANTAQDAITELAGTANASPKFCIAEVLNISGIRKQGQFSGQSDNNSTNSPGSIVVGTFVYNSTSAQITKVCVNLSGVAGMGTAAVVDVYGMD